MTEKSGRIASLDGLRAISILIVVVGHSAVGGTVYAGSIPWMRYLPIHRIALYEHFGVRVFFVISGFLITTLLLKERQTTGTISIGHFYLRRGYRILPASYAVILVVAIV